MIRALENYAILGIHTTIPFLIDVLNSPEFAEGNTHTDFIDHYFENWGQNMEDEDLARIAYVVEELTSLAKTSGKAEAKGWPTPWETLGNWRL
jgi:pyruvate carboxylase